MNKAQTEITIPHLFRCPISLDLLEDPVTLTTGQTYDRSSIEKWISADSQLSENHMEFVEIALSCILKLLPIVNLEPLNIIKDESKLERFIFLFEKGTSSIKTSLCLVIDHSTATAQTEEVCEVLGNSQKLVHEIVQVVFNKNYDKVSEAAIKALSALCSLESNKESLVKGGAINGIITYISRCENRQKNLAPLAMATMKKLLVLESGKEALVNHVNGIETLVKMVFKVCNQECSESAVEILSIVCSDFGRNPPSMRNLAEQDCPTTLKTSQHLGGLQSQYIRDPVPAIRSNVQVGNLRKSQEKDMRGPLSSATSFQPKPQQQQLGSSQAEVTLKAKQPLKSKAPLVKAKVTSEKSTTKCLPAPSVKSGIIPNKSITRNLDASNRPSQIGVKPTRSGGPSPTTLISSGSPAVSLGSPDDYSPTLPKLPQGKAGKKQNDSTQPSTSSNNRGASAPSSNTANKNTLNPISNLLSSLVAKGLISAGTESATTVRSETVMRSKDQTESIAVSSSLPVASVPVSSAVPVKSSRIEADDAAKASLALSQSTSTEIRNLIGFDFKPDVIREMHPHVIEELLDELPHHCGDCGIRLKQQEQFNRHLEWHATKEREQNGLTVASRRWYVTSDDWIASKAECLSESEFTDSVDEYDDNKTDGSQLDTMVEADENQCLCVLCGELFEDVYCQERDEWMFKGAVYLNNPDSDSEMESRNVGPVIHARCLSDNSILGVTNTEHD